jgi:hypothetical protein
MTPGPKAHILGLACETRLRIYDYVFSDTGDKRLKVTLDLNNELHFHNGPTILNLMCVIKQFRQEVLDHLFKHTTFVLTDDQRSCRPIIIAFFQALGRDKCNLVRKLSIPFFTICNLFDPALFQYPYNMQPRQMLRPGTTVAQFLPYVVPYVAALDPLSIVTLEMVQGQIRREIEITIGQHIPRLSNLTYLELGVDVLEFLIYDGSRSSFSLLTDTRNLGETCEVVRSGAERTNFHNLLGLFDMLSPMDRWKDLHIHVRWRNFLVDRSRAAGANIDGTLTADVKTDMRGLYLDLAKQRIEQRGPVKTFDDDVE